MLIITDWAVTDLKLIRDAYELLMHPRVRVNGVDVWGGGYWTESAGSTPSPLSHALATGIKVNGGSTVTLHANTVDPSPTHTTWTEDGGDPQMYASGYLAQAH